MLHLFAYMLEVNTQTTCQFFDTQNLKNKTKQSVTSG